MNVVRVAVGALLSNVAFQFLTTLWDLRPELKRAYELHGSTADLCKSDRTFRVIEEHCMNAALFLEKSYYVELLILTLSKTKWCFGYSCSHDAYWLFRAAAITVLGAVLLRPSVVKAVVQTLREAPAKRRFRRAMAAEKAKVRESSDSSSEDGGDE